MNCRSYHQNWTAENSLVHDVESEFNACNHKVTALISLPLLRPRRIFVTKFQPMRPHVPVAQVADRVALENRDKTWFWPDPSWTIKFSSIDLNFCEDAYLGDRFQAMVNETDANRLGVYSSTICVNKEIPIVQNLSKSSLFESTLMYSL